jgi:hypothetical protein
MRISKYAKFRVCIKRLSKRISLRRDIFWVPRPRTQGPLRTREAGMLSMWTSDSRMIHDPRRELIIG